MSESAVIFLATRLHMLVLLAWVLFLFYIKKETRLRMILLTSISLPISFLISRVASYFYFNPRPFVVDGFESLVFHVADNGFPSDHMLLVSTLSMAVFAVNRTVGFAFILLSVLVGLGRVMAGVHHVLDVVGSLVISILAVCLGYIFISKFVNKKFYGA